MENSVFLDLALFRFTLVSSSSSSCSSRRSTAISWSATQPCTCFWIFLLSGLRSARKPTLEAALESLFARTTVLVVGINQGAWDKGKQLMKVSDLPSTGTTQSIRFILAIFYWQANTFTQLCQNNTKGPFCFEGWNKFSVSIWRAWDPNLTLNEQPHRRQLSLTEEESDFLPLPVFFFGVSSAIADITGVFGEKSIVFHFPRKHLGQAG